MTALTIITRKKRGEERRQPPRLRQRIRPPRRSRRRVSGRFRLRARLALGRLPRKLRTDGTALPSVVLRVHRRAGRFRPAGQARRAEEGERGDHRALSGGAVGGFRSGATGLALKRADIDLWLGVGARAPRRAGEGSAETIARISFACYARLRRASGGRRSSEGERHP